MTLTIPTKRPEFKCCQLVSPAGIDQRMTCQQIIVPVAGMRAKPRLDAALDNKGLFGDAVYFRKTEKMA